MGDPCSLLFLRAMLAWGERYPLHRTKASINDERCADQEFRCARLAAMTATSSRATGTQDLPDRVRGAIWGQLVGDAYCLGAHWIYDLDELKRALPGGVQGFEVPRADHYHAGKVAGDPTHYGDAALLLLQSVAERGEVEAQDFGQRFVTRFGSGDYRGYLDHSMKDTLANAAAFAREHPGEGFGFQQGGDDDQLATVSRLAPVVALATLRGTGQAELLRQVEAITRVTQNNDRAVAYAKTAALVLAALLSGQSVPGALAEAEASILTLEPEHGGEVREKFRAAAEAAALSVEAATAHFGQSCPLEHSFPSSLHCLAKHAGSYPDAMHANAAAGGDNAGRAGMLGAWLGAHLGVSAVPIIWRERLTTHGQVGVAIEKLLAARIAR
jgi:ADP-ribosyl-[dinitrogen reductase] hydrolase